MVLAVIKHPVQRLGTNAIKHEPTSLVSALKLQNNGLNATFRSKSQDIEDTLSCLK